MDNLAELTIMYDNTLSDKNDAPVVTNQVADNDGNNNSNNNDTDHLTTETKSETTSESDENNPPPPPPLNKHAHAGGAAVRRGVRGYIGQQNTKVHAPLSNWENIEKEQQVQLTDFPFLQQEGLKKRM